MAAPVIQTGPPRAESRQPGRAGVARVQPPTPEECAAVWDRPVPGDPSAVVWFLAAHGGAGASTLAHMIDRAGDAGGKWPGGYGRQSPFVVLVAEESVSGLDKAHALVRQYLCDGAGDAAALLGLVTVARVPGRRPQAVRQARELATALVDNDWSVPFIAGLNEATLADLAVWQWGEPAGKKKVSALQAVPGPVAALGEDLIGEIKARIAAGELP